MLFFEKLLLENKQPFTESAMGSMAIGNIIHDAVQKKLPFDFQFSYERPITRSISGIRLKGHFDSLLFFPEKGLIPYDLKTSKIYSFQKLRREGNPYVQNVKQSNNYGYILGSRRAGLAYINKDDFDVLEFEFDVTLKIFNETVLVFKNAFNHVIRLTVPPMCPTCDFGNEKNFVYNYCSFNKSCKQYKQKEVLTFNSLSEDTQKRYADFMENYSRK